MGHFAVRAAAFAELFMAVRTSAAKAAAEGEMKRVLGYDPEQKVSIDFNHTEESSIFAPDQTRVVDGRMVRVLAWYDNEWGYANRLLDWVATLAESHQA